MTAATDMEAGTATPETVIADMYAAIICGDMATFARCFESDAVIWHNYDCQEKSVASSSAALLHMFEISDRIEYRDRRMGGSGKVRFVQHVLWAALKSGAELNLPAMMRIEFGESSRISRLEEYFDSRATDVLYS